MTLRKLSRLLFFITVGMLAILVVLYFSGIMVNTSKSIPVGVYWKKDTSIAVGEYVAFCPPERRVFSDAVERHYLSAGYCEGGYGKMMKKILAAKGDMVSWKNDGVYVNGEKLKYSKPIGKDASGHSLPKLRRDNYKLRGDEILVMTDVSETSFDARYFGTINSSNVVSVIKPVFTWR